jgi:hypothetical protein
MNDVPAPNTPGSPTAAPPGVPFPLPMPPREAPRTGCLKWGLVGCAGASVLVICGLVFLMTNAKNMMDWAFDKMSDQVFAACTADVTPDQKNAFRAALKEFGEKAKAGKVKADQVRAFQSSELAALSDGKVTPEELRDMTAFLTTQAP